MSTPEEKDLNNELEDLMMEEGELDDNGLSVEEAATSEGEDNQESPVEQTAVEDAAEALDPKYKDKGLEDVILMHRNSETAMHKAMREKSDLQKKYEEQLRLNNQILERQLGGNGAVVEGDKPLTIEYLLENPDKDLREILALKEKQSEDESATSLPQVTMTEEDFNQKHPNSAQIGESPEFIEWVQKSPGRTRMLLMAAQTSDFDLADELLTTYNEVSPSLKAAREAATKKRAEDANALSGSRTSVKRDQGKRIYSEEKLKKLYLKDPDKFYDLTAEGTDLALAYKEGRVR